MVLKSRWASWKCLKPLDFHLAVAIRDTTPDVKLKEAYHDAIGKYDWNRLEYWKDRLYAMKLANDTAPVSNGNGKRKREAVPATKPGYQFKWPPGFGPECGDGEEGDDEAGLFLPSGESKRRKVKKEAVDTMTLAEINALYEDSDADALFSARKGSKRAVLDTPMPPLGMRRTSPSFRRHKSTSLMSGNPRDKNRNIE